MSVQWQVGCKVLVAGRGRGMLEMENDDGTWNVGFNDGSEGDIRPELLQTLDGASQIERAGSARIVPKPYDREKPQGWTRFVCFSDTHGLHDGIPAEHRPEADVLLHAGDFTNTGEVEQVQSLSAWLKSYPAKEKVVIAGNHDITFQPSYYERAWRRFHRQPYDCEQARQALLGTGCCTYLEDQVVEVMGYRIYGSPWQPEFCDWAFNLQDWESKAVWDRIPPDVDILMTHGPPHGMGDVNTSGMNCGCKQLSAALRELAVPVSLCGHIHEGYGVDAIGKTLCINASTCTHSYRPSNAPIVFDLPPVDELRRVVSTMAAVE